MSETKIAAIMGFPVAHSRSPLLHGHWLKRYGIQGAYLPLKISPEKIGAALRALPILGFAGCNLTVPHKETALLHLDFVDPLARRISSVNTVVVREDGRLEGFSTDGFGFIENLRQRVPDWTSNAGSAVILGAGGSARAIAAALSDAGAHPVIIVNRTRERADRLVQDLNGPLRALAWEELDDVLPTCRLLVNTTMLGMEGQPALNIDLTQLSKDAIVADIVYAPLETPLLRQATLRGNRTVDGLGMLLHQARPGFASWFGVEPAVDEELRQVLLQSLAR